MPESILPLMNVEKAVASLDQFEGRTVRVAGYLGQCAGYECVLFSSQGEEQRYAEWIANLREMPFQDFKAPILGVGSADDFDRKVAPFVPGYVIITGTLINVCRDANGQPACLDRTTDIIPTGIQELRFPPVPSQNPEDMKATLN